MLRYGRYTSPEAVDGALPTAANVIPPKFCIGDQVMQLTMDPEHFPKIFTMQFQKAVKALNEAQAARNHTEAEKVSMWKDLGRCILLGRSE